MTFQLGATLVSRTTTRTINNNTMAYKYKGHFAKNLVKGKHERDFVQVKGQVSISGIRMAAMSNVAIIC